MGATHVTVTIRNPADPDRAWEGLFLVDTGATDSLVPRPHLESIGLRPKGQRVYELADGREIVMEITTADIEFMGEDRRRHDTLRRRRYRTVARGDRPGVRGDRSRPEQSTAQETARGAAQEPPERPPVSTTVFADSILPAEQRVIHVALPNRARELQHRCSHG